MLEDNLTDDLLENEDMLPRLYLLGGFGEDPAFKSGVGFSIDHVYFGEKGVEVS